MTRVKLPATTPHTNTSCITTIVDSQGGDAALIQALSSSLSRRNSDGSLTALLDRGGDYEPRESSGSTGPNSGSAAPPPPPPPTVPELIESFASAAAASTGGNTIENVDSIVLVYDLDRVETFFRVENHWLPLIERCYAGKVCI
jgi:hypothetical protein